MAKSPHLGAGTSERSTDSEAVTQAEFQALANFRLELRRYLAFAHRAAQGHGVTMEQNQAMLAVQAAEGGSLSTGELAELLFLRPHSTVELVDRLVKLGLVERRKDPGDARRKMIALTENGQAKLQALSASHLSELGALGPKLGRALRHAVKSGRS